MTNHFTIVFQVLLQQYVYKRPSLAKNLITSSFHDLKLSKLSKFSLIKARTNEVTHMIGDKLSCEVPKPKRHICMESVRR